MANLPLVPTSQTTAQPTGDSERIPTKPSLCARISVALAFALVAGVVSWYVQFPAGARGGDFGALWRAAQVVLDGGDPYQILRWHGQIVLPDAGRRFFYPLPAVAIGLPFAALRPSTAAVMFSALSAALLGFALTKHGFERVPLLLSVPFLECAQFGQTTSLIVALGLIPEASGLSLIKPNVGLPLFLWRPSRWAFATAALLFAGSVLVEPSWPVHWLTLVRSSYMHRAPIETGVGALALLALLRWRAPESRLLAAMTVIPHALYYYDQLPLFLIPRTRRQSMALALASWIGLAISLSGPSAGNVLRMQRWVVISLYLPAAAMILLRDSRTACSVRRADMDRAAS